MPSAALMDQSTLVWGLPLVVERDVAASEGDCEIFYCDSHCKVLFLNYIISYI